MIPCPVCANEMAEVRGERPDRRECTDCKVTWIVTAFLEEFPHVFEGLRIDDFRRRDFLGFEVKLLLICRDGGRRLIVG